MVLFQLTNEIRFPPPKLAEPNGLLAIGGDLEPARLIEAYRNGIFPWFSDGDPVLWWFTSPRLVLFPNEFRISKRLAREIRKDLFTIRFDTDFEQIIDKCGSCRTDNGEETWITSEMKDAYCTLHDLGFCHSVECWQNKTLVGGLYGLYLDRIFFGESMFSDISNGSKFALVALVRKLIDTGCKVIDCQMTTAHLLSFGAREISGEDFQDLLRRYIKNTVSHGKWNNHEE